MEFASPHWLWALLALPVIVAAEAWLVRRDRSRTARLVSRVLWPRVVHRRAEGWRWARLALVLVGVAGLATAMARPRWGIVREKVDREGVDVVLVVDTSGSMATDDVQPSRFAAARASLLDLVGTLDGDRVALVALEGDAYALVPLTLDLDAVGLFLDTLEPGAVPTPGTSIGAGLDKALSLFVDEERDNKVVVLVSDGEDLEGGLDDALARARKAGVVVHTVGIGTEQGAPVPDFDAEGRRSGFKRHDDGSVVVSRLHADTLQRIAEETGGRYVRMRGVDTSLWPIAAAIEGMDQRTFSSDYRYRRKERYQWPLGVAVAALLAALALPLPERRRRGAALPLLVAVLLPGAVAVPAQAAPAGQPEEGSRAAAELLLKPYRFTAAGRSSFADGDFPRALERFQEAAGARPDDPRLTFNVADALYKTGEYAQAEALFAALARKGDARLAAAARYNLGNARYMQQRYRDAADAYRSALEVAPDDLETRRNLERALRALEEQKKQQEQQQNQQSQDRKQDQRKDQEQDRQSKDGEQREQEERQQSPQAGQQQERQQRPMTDEEKEQQRFEKETGMPKERAMQLLEALQQNEKAQQKKLLAAKRAGARKGKDW